MLGWEILLFVRRCVGRSKLRLMVPVLGRRQHQGHMRMPRNEAKARRLLVEWTRLVSGCRLG